MRKLVIVSMLITRLIGIFLLCGSLYQVLFTNIRFNWFSFFLSLGLLCASVCLGRINSIYNGEGNESDFVDATLAKIFGILGIAIIVLAFIIEYVAT